MAQVFELLAIDPVEFLIDGKKYRLYNHEQHVSVTEFIGRQDEEGDEYKWLMIAGKTGEDLAGEDRELLACLGEDRYVRYCIRLHEVFLEEDDEDKK